MTRQTEYQPTNQQHALQPEQLFMPFSPDVKIAFLRHWDAQRTRTLGHALSRRIQFVERQDDLDALDDEIVHTTYNNQLFAIAQALQTTRSELELLFRWEQVFGSAAIDSLVQLPHALAATRATAHSVDGPLRANPELQHTVSAETIHIMLQRIETIADIVQFSALRQSTPKSVWQRLLPKKRAAHLSDATRLEAKTTLLGHLKDEREIWIGHYIDSLLDRVELADPPVVDGAFDTLAKHYSQHVWEALPEDFPSEWRQEARYFAVTLLNTVGTQGCNGLKLVLLSLLIEDTCRLFRGTNPDISDSQGAEIINYLQQAGYVELFLWQNSASGIADTMIMIGRLPMSNVDALDSPDTPAGGVSFEEEA